MNEYKYLKIAFSSIIALIAALTLYGLYINQASQRHIEKMVEAEYAVLTVDEAEYRDIHTTIENVDITVKALWKIDVEAQIEGTVDGIYVEAGQRVEAGQPLFALKNNDILAQIAGADASIAEARANLINCEQKVKRYSELIAGDAISSQDYDDAIASRDAARARLDNCIAQRDLMASQQSKMVVTAPQAADVLNVYCKYGYYVRTGEPLAMLADIGDLSVTSVLDGATLERLQPLEQEYILEIRPYLLAYKAYPILERHNEDGLQMNQFSLRFAKVFPAPDQTAAYHRIAWKLKNFNGLLEPTTYQNARIFSKNTKHVLTIPRKAIGNYDNNNTAYVFCVDKNTERLVRREVKTGAAGGEYVEILAGISDGEQVVISENIDLSEGMRVKTKDEAER